MTLVELAEMNAVNPLIFFRNQCFKYVGIKNNFHTYYNDFLNEYLTFNVE